MDNIIDNYPVFKKIPRLFRDIVISEKIDGTNAQVYIPEDPSISARKVWAGSRNRWLEPGDDNYGFAKWVDVNFEDLLTLGPGHHYGEWWGKGIGRNYAQPERRFSLFNTHRWSDEAVRPKCCGVVPVLYTGLYHQEAVLKTIRDLKKDGSVVAPGFMNPEGVIVFHTASNQMYKVTIEGDEKPKGQQ